MVLVSDYNKKTGEQYNIYLETFPFKVYDFDIKIIFDTALDKMLENWCVSIRCLNPRRPFDELAEGKPIWITDVTSMEHELTRDKMVAGIGQALKIHKYSMLNFRQELDTPCYSADICDEIVQFALYGEIRFF